MGYGYSDPTANAAIGNIIREENIKKKERERKLKRARKRAEEAHKRKKSQEHRECS